MTIKLDSSRPVPFYFITTGDPADFSGDAVKNAMLQVKDAVSGEIVYFNKPPR